MSTRHLFAALPVADSPLVERPAPGAAPTAFRIWAAGRNDSDDGPVFFTAESARRLMAEQEARGHQYAIDFDHLSLQTDRPATSGRAAGYHRIETRPNAAGELELWAVDIEWTADVKAALELEVPHWKFFSPAFKTRIEGKGKDARDTGEIAGYLNFALCINPKTHDLPALASQVSQSATSATTQGAIMADKTIDPAKCKAQLQSMFDNEVDDEKKAALGHAMKLAFPPEDAAAKDTGGSPDAPDGNDMKKQQDAVTEEDPKKDDDASRKAAHKAKALEGTVNLAHRVAELEAEQLRSTIAARPDLPDSLKEWCQTQSIEVVRSFLAKVPKQMAARNARASIPTEGEDGGGAAPLLTGPDRELMDRQMGMNADAARMPEKQADGSLVIHVTKPSAVRAAAMKGKE